MIIAGASMQMPRILTMLGCFCGHDEQVSVGGLRPSIARKACNP
jgi:hypothetical protein